MWSLLIFDVYGVLYGSASDARWHECGHGTAFKTHWMNDAVYEIASFMLMRNPVTWRWSHARHHTDTIIVGRDAEIAVMRPPDLLRVALNFVGIVDVWRSLNALVRNAAGILSDDEKSFIPEEEWGKAVFSARVHVAIYVARSRGAHHEIVAAPRDNWPPACTAAGTGDGRALQHGPRDNVVDYRLNTRTVYMNPISRSIYWNMNYHIEHHMCSGAASDGGCMSWSGRSSDAQSLHLACLSRDDPALVRQLRNEEYFVKRELPPTEGLSGRYQPSSRRSRAPYVR